MHTPNSRFILLALVVITCLLGTIVVLDFVVGSGIRMPLEPLPPEPGSPSIPPIDPIPLPIGGTENPGMIACTQEAKICPDGSAVGRTGPHCEFAACPGESN